MRGLAVVSLFASREFKRNNHTAAAFECSLVVFLVGHKEFQESLKKGPEPALPLVSAIEILPFEHAHEELLR
jgi:hypothetical protein